MKIFFLVWIGVFDRMKDVSEELLTEKDIIVNLMAEKEIPPPQDCRSTGLGYQRHSTKSTPKQRLTKWFCNER